MNLILIMIMIMMISRRVRLRLEKKPGETGLIARPGRSLKMEPLATVRQLERYLLKMVAKQWYDFERASFNFIKKIQDGNVTFTHENDFDENGLMYWIGTNGKTATDWVNPAQVIMMIIMMIQ